MLRIACGIFAIVVLAGILFLLFTGGINKKKDPPDRKVPFTGESSTVTGGTQTGMDAESDTVPPEAESRRSLYEFDPPEDPASGVAIRPIDLSVSAAGAGYIVNESGVLPGLLTVGQMKERLLPGRQVSENQPTVLIIHTHTTEAYDPTGEGTCNPGATDFARSDDPEKSVVAVGRVFAEALEESGVRTVHCTEVFDGESYRGAYGRAAAAIGRYLAQYPGIRYIIDIHRDSVTDSSGNLLRAVTEVNGEATAQVLCVVGTGENAAKCPWMYNFTLAQWLRSALNEQFGNLCRPTVLRPSSYNQQYAEMSMLLEIGTSGNTLAEAQRAARLAGTALAQLLLAEDSGGNG